MKVAIIGSRGYPYVYSGYETFVKELVERLVDKPDIELTVYCHKQLFSHRPATYKGVNLVYLSAIESKSLAQLSHSTLAFLHAIYSRYDVILAVNSANGPFGVLTKLFGIKTAINVDGMEWLRPKWKGLGSKYFYLSSWMATRLFDVIVNDSDAMRKVYLDEFNSDSEVIAYGAYVKTSSQPQLINKWGLQSRGYYLIVGRLIPDNNANLILDGFLKSSTKRKLVIVGDVPYADKYASAIKLSGEADPRVIFTGYVTDPQELLELYCNCYVYLHGHEYGGTNPTMLKAMGYQCAILALNTAFNQEMLNNGEFGDFFEKDLQDIANQINHFDSQEDYVKQLRKKAQFGLTEKYNWEHVSNQYYQLFKNLLK